MKKYLIGAIILLSACKKESPIDFSAIDAKGDILFLSRRTGNTADWHMFLMNADGSGQKEVANISTTCARPVLSHDGKKIAFSSVDNTNTVNLFVVDIDGQNKTLLAQGRQSCGSPAWSKDDAMIVFAKQVTAAGNSDIYTVRVDGTNETKLTTANNNYSPQFFSNSNTIVYAADNGASWFGIYKMNADGSNKQLLTPVARSFSDPKVSSDDSKIAFTSLDWNGSQIFVMNNDGSGLQQLTSTVNPHYYDVGFPREGNIGPVWSPVAATLAYTSYANGSPDVFTINADGSSNKRLTNTSRNDENPSWTNDGEYILFTSNRNIDVSWEIYIMRSNGQSQTPLTNYVGDDVYPVFIQK